MDERVPLTGINERGGEAGDRERLALRFAASRRQTLAASRHLNNRAEQDLRTIYQVTSSYYLNNIY